MGILDFNRVPDKALPARLQDGALNATYVPRWKANTAYLAGEKVLSPSGDVVSAKVNFTSSASYDASNWDLSANVSGKLDKTEAASTYGRKGTTLHAEEFGVKNDGANYSVQMQAALDAVMAVRGTLVLPDYVVKASDLKARGSFAIVGGTPGTGDLRYAGAATLTPAVAGKPILTIEYGDGWVLENFSFRHDRSFAADGLQIGGAVVPNGNRWFHIRNINAVGFQGFGMKIWGTMWESKIDNLMSRQNGDPAQDKAGVELYFPADSDPDTLEFSNLNNVFPRYIGFRMKAENRPTSTTSSGLRGLALRGGIWHSGTSDTDHLTRPPYSMGVIDGFTSMLIDGVNFASCGDSQWMLELDGTAMDTGSKSVHFGRNIWNGPLRIGKVQDVRMTPQDWRLWSAAAMPEHIKVEAAASNVKVAEQDVLNGGKFVLTDNATGTVKPSEEVVFVPAAEFVSAVGSPSLNRVASRYPAWLLDSVAVEQVNGAFAPPHYWKKFNVEVIWTQIGTATGNVRLQLGYSLRKVGDDFALGDVFPAAVVDVAPAQNVSKVTTLATDVSNGIGLWHARISRQATDATDTLEATDMALIGLRLRRTL